MAASASCHVFLLDVRPSSRDQPMGTYERPINLYIPWNPGTLEQRIGRIYRLGQEKPVNIINLVAQESIEHNLLGVIQFKKSMAAGVLDDGEDTIFMGDSKFKQFMASVETITRDTVNSMASVSPDEIETPVTAVPTERSDDDFMPDTAAAPEAERSTKAPSPESATDLDTPDEQTEAQPAQNRVAQNSGNSAEALVQNGLQFFTKLAQTLSDPQATEKLVKSIVHKDEKTGQTYVKLPVENEQAVEGLFNMLGGLLKAMET